MKLNEKIITCRKQKGYSQEDLANQLGVSRQSVSKWETGESMPDINKLVSIAKVFDVTTDWLLTDDNEEIKEEKNITNNSYPDWLDKLPKSILRMIQKFGWIAGIYIMGEGILFSAAGLLARFMFKTMILGDTKQMIDQVIVHHSSDHIPYHHLESMILSPQYGIYNEVQITGWKIASTFTGFIFGIGVVLIIVGLVLAIVLKKWGKNELEN